MRNMRGVLPREFRRRRLVHVNIGLFRLRFWFSHGQRPTAFRVRAAVNEIHAEDRKAQSVKDEEQNEERRSGWKIIVTAKREVCLKPLMAVLSFRASEPLENALTELQVRDISCRNQSMNDFRTGKPSTGRTQHDHRVDCATFEDFRPTDLQHDKLTATLRQMMHACCKPPRLECRKHALLPRSGRPPP